MDQIKHNNIIVLIFQVRSHMSAPTVRSDFPTLGPIALTSAARNALA